MAAKRVSPASPLGEKHIFENQTVKLGRKGGVELTVREQVRAADGATFPDVSAWFWRARLGLCRGPYLAVTVVNGGRGAFPL